MFKIWQWGLLLLLLLLLKPPSPEANLSSAVEHSLLRLWAQCRELASGNVRISGPARERGSNRCRKDAQIGSVLIDLRFPCCCLKNLVCRGARIGLQGKAGTQPVRRPDYSDASSSCGEILSLQRQPSGSRWLRQAAISPDSSSTPDFNVNFLLLLFEINTARSLILPVA